MKPRKTFETYAVLTVSQIRALLAIAEKEGIARHGENHEHATVILRGNSVKFDGKIQFHAQTAAGENL